MNLNLCLAILTTTAIFIASGASVLSAEDDEQPLAGATKNDPRIDFVKQIQPIFQRSCIRCHGAEKQKGDYRVDVRETALKGGESFAPNIVPGKSSESPLIRFITGNGDLLMPPEGERLATSDIALLRTWIDQGAEWPDEVAGHAHDKSDLWSLKPLLLPDVPPVPPENKQLPSFAIDAFIRAKLAANNFASSPEADRRTLIRRVSFDLIGLPPSPEEVDRFVSDPDPGAYEKLVDRLLESPRYGERWARHWLDTAHFAETHGNDQDRIREHAWPYRDYLIESFNSDKPYSRFIQEQVAGDVLFPETPSAIVALGFLAAGPWDESSLRDIREDTLDRQIARYLDRDDMLATVINNVCGMTVQCARCHDHKFDPISQNDYYSLQAVFSGVERANRRYDADSSVHLRRSDLIRRKQGLAQRSAEAMARLMSADVQQSVSRWEQHLTDQTGTWQVIDVASFASSDGAELKRLPDGSILSSGPRPDKDTVTIVSAPLPLIRSRVNDKQGSVEGGTTESSPRPVADRLSRITAVKLEVMTDESLPRSGPGRQDNGNLHLSEFEISIEGKDNPIELVNPTADFNQSGWEIGKSIDRNESTAWGIDPREGAPHHAIFELKEPLSLSDSSPEPRCSQPADSDNESAVVPIRLRFVLKQLHGRGHLIGRMRLSLTDSKTPIRVDAIPEEIMALLKIPHSDRSEAQRIELAAFQQLDEINRALSSLPAQKSVYAAAADFEPEGGLRPPTGPRPIHVLHRGDIRQPREEASPGSLACLSALPSRFDIPGGAPESARRAALAQWLTHKNNPLTWRSIVNRIWHHHFGRGIVPTLNDFGHMGEAPSHPELLDWLAIEFRDGGQSVKQLHRLILTSGTYRQSVESPSRRHDAPSDPLTEPDTRVVLDADNRLLWRMNRTRLDAESIRDAVLAISGRLDLRMGGPSDRQFDLQPGIHVTPRVDYGKFDPTGDLGRRRSIYRFLFRTLPDPFMESLDCPSGDQMTPARGNSVTVQQALALWNNVFIAQSCEQIAIRIDLDLAKQLQEPTGPVVLLDQQIERSFLLILGRAPLESELPDVRRFTQQHGLANLCRLLLNSNEFLFVN